MREKSNTPETDKAKKKIHGFADEWVPRYICEELERERDEAREAICEIRDAFLEHAPEFKGVTITFPWEKTKLKL